MADQKTKIYVETPKQYFDLAKSQNESNRGHKVSNMTLNLVFMSIAHTNPLFFQNETKPKFESEIQIRFWLLTKYKDLNPVFYETKLWRGKNKISLKAEILMKYSLKSEIYPKNLVKNVKIR